MTNQQSDHNQIIRLCNGRKDAIHWLQLGRIYVHEIDDLIDEDIPSANRASGAERACRIGAMAIELYTHPFFVANSAVLSSAMRICTNNYADSVRWEKSETKWKRGFSDWARHSWLDVVLVVADICGGYSNMRNESAELRAISYADHHNSTGEET